MSQQDRACDAHDDVLPRRKFLRNSLYAALPAIVTATPAVAAVTMAGPLPALMSTSSYSPPTRYRGSAVVSVRNFGAVGDGSTDDTTAFRNAIDSLPATGGTVDVPAGTYLIDPVRRVPLRSKMHLRLADGAVLKAKANSAERAYVLMLNEISDVAVSGGKIEGDRDRHLGTTGQWGHGIMLRGCKRVTIRDILVTKCWGDGISISGTSATASKPSVGCDDVVFSNIACVDNRRQGMSIGRVNNVKIYDSEFSYSTGIDPGCGIDIEPDTLALGVTTNVHIENCWIHHNQGNGVQIYRYVQGTTLKGNKVEFNGGYGILSIGAVGGNIAANHVTSNQLIGIGMRSSSSSFTLSDNHFYNNGRKFRTWDLKKLSPAQARTGNVLARHTEVAASTNIQIDSNLYYDK